VFNKLSSVNDGPILTMPIHVIRGTGKGKTWNVIKYDDKNNVRSQNRGRVNPFIYNALSLKL